MSQVIISDIPNTVCVFYWSFWGKNRRFLKKICETVTSKGQIFESPITPVYHKGQFHGYNILKAYEKCYKMRHVCTLAVGALWRYFGAKS
jgi:hypothetical protein